MGSAKLRRLGVCAAAAGAAALLFRRTSGVATLTCFGAAGVGALLCLKYLLESAAALFGKELTLRSLSLAALALAALWLPVLPFEVYLTYLAGRKVDPAAPGDSGPALAMPKEWRKRPVHIAGASTAYYWHGKLHIYNADRMRVLGYFPPRRADTCRVMVLGDSLTYGRGVADEETYCRVLERQLRRRYRIEILNLGRCGDQSEDMVRTLRTHFPALQPDLVVYGVCLNDFLPSGVVQYENNMAWPVRFPGQAHLLYRTEVGPFLARKYDELLRHWGVRADFWQDILRDFRGYQRRFARDVRELNAYVRARGLPPVVAMVLCQEPGPGVQSGLTAVAEKYLREAGMEVVPAGFIRECAGQTWHVSAWEGHPNEKAHAVFAEYLRPHLEKSPALRQYRR